MELMFELIMSLNRVKIPMSFLQIIGCGLFLSKQDVCLLRKIIIYMEKRGVGHLNKFFSSAKLTNKWLKKPIIGI